MNIFPLGILFLAACSLSGVWADANSDALRKLALLPAPPMIITMDQASSSPSVVMTAKGALVNKSQTPVPFDQVLIALAALPPAAWPNGRVVLFSSQPASASGNAAAYKSKVEKVESALQGANIRLLIQN